MKILLSYTDLPTRFFGDSWEFNYELEIYQTSFFGLIKKTKKVHYTISMFQSIREHTKHWDELIRTKKPIR